MKIPKLENKIQVASNWICPNLSANFPNKTEPIKLANAYNDVAKVVKKIRFSWFGYRLLIKIETTELVLIMAKLVTRLHSIKTHK